MSLQSKIKTTPNCAVFCRNYQQHLEDASNKTPEELITFRSYLKWTSAELAVKTHGHRKIYLALGEDSTDRQVLELSAQEGRILVSHDQKTMPNYFAEFITSQTSPGLIIVSKKLSINEAIETLILIWSVSSAEEWINRIAFLPL